MMEMPEKIYRIDLRDIEVSPLNVRSTDPEVGIEDLMKSIEKHGLIQPVTLRGTYGNPPYELIVGQRRFLAHQKLKKNEIKAVFAGHISDEEAKILSLIENVHREELNHADRAKTITALYIQYNRSVQRVAQELGLSEKTVRDDIRIEELATDKAKKLLRNGEIKREDVKRVIDAAQGDSEKADEFLDKMSKMVKYEKDRAVNYGKSHPDATADEIVEYGKKPQFEFTVMLRLPKEVDEALEKAMESYAMEKELLAAKALSEWLEDKGFLRPELQIMSGKNE